MSNPPRKIYTFVSAQTVRGLFSPPWHSLKHCNFFICVVCGGLYHGVIVFGRKTFQGKLFRPNCWNPSLLVINPRWGGCRVISEWKKLGSFNSWEDPPNYPSSATVLLVITYTWRCYCIKKTRIRQKLNQTKQNKNKFRSGKTNQKVEFNQEQKDITQLVLRMLENKNFKLWRWLWSFVKP